MVAGYVRLSRDDDKKNYISIENQKMLINHFAANLGLVIDRWYEDDGISGYSFNRSGFGTLLSDLDNDIDVIIAKDLSRIGRHNAKVLLFLDDLRERGKRLLIVDDNYDTMEDEDDIIGIKTWYNERYVKDTSKKIRSVIRARQIEGTLMNNVPFGYRRNKDNIDNKAEILINENEAFYVRKVFDLYMQGFGYRRIAVMLTEQGIPTPSMVLNERSIIEGKTYRRAISDKWSDGMVSDILKNDFYIGTLRLNKRTRTTINGTDHRVPKEKQIAFYKKHEAIITDHTFELVQSIMQKRVKTNYRGQSKEGTVFGNCLYCKDCGSRLIPILRTGDTKRRYYICNTYNTKGKRFCEHTHLIYEEELVKDVIKYIKFCRETLSEIIRTYDFKELSKERKAIEVRKKSIIEAIEVNKKQLKTLLSHKIKEISTGADSDLINETYAGVQCDILTQIHGYELQLKELDDTNIDTADIHDKLTAALDVIDLIIQKDNIDRRDIEILVEKITVDKEGFPDMELKYGLSSFVKYNPSEELNKQEHEIIIATLKLIRDEEREYTSAKYLSAQLTKLGYPKSKKSVLPYISIMIGKGVLRLTEDNLKPYKIQMTKEELTDMINNNIDTMSAWWYARDGIRVHLKETRD
ncbi:MAG: Recombinase [Herbinix sp.]|nr:Recombinase [Herbinix sp.]